MTAFCRKNCASFNEYDRASYKLHLPAIISDASNFISTFDFFSPNVSRFAGSSIFICPGCRGYNDLWSKNVTPDARAFDFFCVLGGDR